MTQLEGKVAIITGAGKGLGRGMALRFAREGAAVVVSDVDAEAAEATVSEIVASGGRACPHLGDVTERETNDALVARALEWAGGLDVWVCNAGGATPEAMEAISGDRYRADLLLNLDAVWHGMQAVLPGMVERGGGVILTVSSGAGLGAVHGLAPYGAAKAGVIALTRNVALEYGPRGVRANVICPGPIESPGMLAWLETIPGGPEAFAVQTPMRRLGTPEDIAAAALFLVSDEAGYVNGAVLPVDGGVSAVLASPRVAEEP